MRRRWQPILMRARTAVAKTYLQASMPAMSASGTEAVVGIALWAPEGGCHSGFVAFLTKQSGAWVVKGYGCFWVT